MKSINLVENSNVVATGIFFGNAEETIKEIQSGVPVQNVVRTISRDNGEIEQTILAENYFLWSSRELLNDIISTYPKKYTNRGNTLVLVDSSDSFAKFNYVKVDGQTAIVTVEIVPVENDTPEEDTPEMIITDDTALRQYEEYTEALILVAKTYGMTGVELENILDNISTPDRDSLDYKLSYVECSACGHNSLKSKFVEDGRGFCVLCGGTIVGIVKTESVFSTPEVQHSITLTWYGDNAIRNTMLRDLGLAIDFHFGGSVYMSGLMTYAEKNLLLSVLADHDLSPDDCRENIQER